RSPRFPRATTTDGIPDPLTVRIPDRRHRSGRIELGGATMETLPQTAGAHRATDGRPRRGREETPDAREEAREALPGAGRENRAWPRVPARRGREARQGDEPGEVRHHSRAPPADGRRSQARRPDGPRRGGAAARP